MFAGVSCSTLPEKELDQIPDKDEVTSSILVSPTETMMKVLLRIASALALAFLTAVSLRVGSREGSPPSRGGWRPVDPAD